MVVISDKKIGVDVAPADGIIDYYNADVISAQDYYPFGMTMPGRKYSQPNTTYRYGFNGQEKSTEINGSENLYTAEYWEYDSRIGRRWNVDPVSKEWESPYATFSNNPIINIDPNGDSDSTYSTPGGGAQRAETSRAETFDGSTQKVGKINVTPAKGTLKAFSEWNGGEPGETSRFVATFNTKSGEFAGYVWDGDGKTTYAEFSKAKREDLENMAANWDNPIYQHYSSREEARKSAINLTVGLAIPNVIIKPLTIAVNIEKFTVDANKFNYFFGKVVTGPQTNIARSAQNLKDLTQLGITTEDKLMKVFSQAMQSGATVSTKVTQYGTNVMKSVNVGGKGSIEVGFFYKAGNMSAKPAVTTIIPKIFK